MNDRLKTTTGVIFTVLATCAHGQGFIYSPVDPVTIPDADLSGLQSTINIPSSFSGTVSTVEITLNLKGSPQDGGFAGDLYVALYHQGRAVVLINRPGRDAVNPFGYDDTSDFQITFSDSAFHDIHQYQNFAHPVASTGLSGRWQPDGRTANFNSVVTADPRAAMLNQLNGTNMQGQWTLFLADVSGGGVTDLTSWSVHFVQVPEVSGGTLTAALLLGLWAMGRSFFTPLTFAKHRQLVLPVSVSNPTAARNTFIEKCSSSC